jgi:hypothetical protein
MTTTRFALVAGSAAALLFSGVAGGCGGATALLDDDGGTEGHPSSGSSSGASGSSSSGASGTSSSSGASGSSTSSSSGISSSSSSGISSSSTSGGSSSSSGISSSSSSGGSSSSSGISSSSSSGGSSSGGPDTGTIYFEQCSGAGALCQSPSFQFYASFGPASGGNQGCTVTTSGSCAAYTCPGNTPPPPSGLNAGTLTISGGSLGAAIPVTPDPTYNYQYQANGVLFTGGQTLTVRGSGGTVPPFGPISVVAPGLPALLTPVATSTTYTISTKSDMKVAWTGGAAGAQLIFEAASGNSASYFTCEWPASAGVGVVPQAMLAPLGGQTNGYLIYGQYTATSFAAGPYSISASALPYSGSMATFE